MTTCTPAGEGTRRRIGPGDILAALILIAVTAPPAPAQELLASASVIRDDRATASALRTVEIPFAAMVGTVPFTCGERYTLHGSEVEGRDLRFYVSEVQLVTADGRAVPLELEQDGLWQHRDLALLDFENGTAGCRNGNALIRDRVVGVIPEGEYTSLRFTVGVPHDLNHINQATAPSPLSLTALFWSWNAGYKFMRAEVLSDGLPQGFFIHLGSTRCSPEGRASEPATSCANSNRVTVELPFVEGRGDRVVLDLATLLDGTNLVGDEETERGACMSSPEDARCAPIFDALGLPFPGLESPRQRVFRVEPGAPGVMGGGDA